MQKINQKVLMSGVDYFAIEEINAYAHKSNPPDPDQTKREYHQIQQALESAGIEIVRVPAPEGCQDGVFTANWGLVRNGKVIPSWLPNKRKDEEVFAKKAFQELGLEIIEPPVRFSGQGDALPCGNKLFIGQGYRTDQVVHAFIAENLGYEVIGLQAVPQLDSQGIPVVNTVTGWPDSFFYDIDLAISVINPELIAWCPEAFTPAAQATMRAVTDIEKIEVTLEEAENFACNLISTGETVVMGNRAPQLQAELEARGLKVITVDIQELGKAGGYIRCTTLSLDNS